MLVRAQKAALMRMSRLERCDCFHSLVPAVLIATLPDAPFDRVRYRSKFSGGIVIGAGVERELDACSLSVERNYVLCLFR